MTLLEERPIRPMLAKTGEPFDSDSHIFEPKWDGLRAILFKLDNKVELQNRNLRNVTTGYPELTTLAASVKAKSAILDGEVVVLSPKGTPDFHQLQNRFGIDDPKRAEILGKTIPVTYVAFDLLHLNGQDLVNDPLESRKKRLKAILHEGPNLLYGDHVESHGKRFFAEASSKGFEGILAKEKNSVYQPGTRAASWIKIKGSRTIDCVIVGFTKGEGARASTFGSLVLAVYNKNSQLKHVGNVGGGLDNQTLNSLKQKMLTLVRKTPAIEGTIEAPTPVTWTRPSLVCEVRYMSLTTDEKLRFPRFSRLRPDKTPEECRLEH